MLAIKRNKNCVYQTAYHLVWCPKYRKRILVGKIARELDVQIQIICQHNHWSILAQEIQPDHIHIFLSTPPSISIATAVKLLKGISSRVMLQKFPELKKQFWSGHLWAPSYYAGTAGNVSAKTIQNYIQRTEHLQARR